MGAGICETRMTLDKMMRSNRRWKIMPFFCEERVRARFGNNQVRKIL